MVIIFFVNFRKFFLARHQEVHGCWEGESASQRCLQASIGSVRGDELSMAEVQFSLSAATLCVFPEADQVY